MKLRRRYFFTLVCAFGLAACFTNSATFNATDITGASFGKSLRLNDHTGVPRSLTDFKGHIVLISFGFTHCPDYCPATLALWAEAMKRLGDDAKRVQALFITVDPERDTPELLSKYVPAFHPRFLGMTGTPEQIKAAAAEFKVVYQKAAGATPATYTVDHSTQSFVFDTSGNIRLMVPHGMEVEKLVADIKRLVRQTR